MATNPKDTLIVFISVLCLCIGAINLSCDKVDPKQPSNLRCTCKHTSDKGIQWYKNNTFENECYLETETCLRRPFSVNSEVKEYNMSKNFYNYSSCEVYTCRDFYNPEVNASQRIAAQDSTSISVLNISEPATNHTSGFIGLITECIYGAFSEEKYLDIQWIVVMEGEEISFNPVKTKIKSLNGSCQLCDGDKAAKFLIGLYHEEEMGCQAGDAKYRIIIRHNRTSSEPLNITTENFYCVPGKMKSGSTRSKRLPAEFLLLAYILLSSITVITVCLCIFCSGTNTERTSSCVVSSETENSDEDTQDVQDDANTKQLINMNI